MGSTHFPSNLEMRDKGCGYADLRRLKSIAQKYLPAGSHLRDIILAEPDHIPCREATIKVVMFARLLDAELRSAQ
jgi:hypothetical protein